MDRDPEPITTTFNILFVCSGNTCRSPMAEGLARAELTRRGWKHVTVGSAGTSAQLGEEAAPHAVTLMARRGIDLSDHLSRPLTPELVAWADLILGMSTSHLTAVARLGGAEKMALLGDFATDESAGEEMAPHAIPDPFGGDEAVYEETLIELDHLVRRAVDRLAPILAP